MGKGGLTRIVCAHCGTEADKLTGGVNRSLRIGAPLYCSQACSGLAHRSEPVPVEVKRKAKQRYDRARRNGPLRQRILDEKRAAYRALTHDERHEQYLRARARREADPDLAAAYREACVKARNTPEWKAHKREYDRRWRAATEFGDGPLADAFVLLQELIDEVNSRIHRPDIYHQKGRTTAIRRKHNV